ncbi:MAG: phosphatidate cytidylyltransferase [Candidatus Kapaibacteriales bacterium]
MALSNLTKRILFSVVAVPVVLFLMWLGDIWFVTAIMLIAAITLEEYYRFARIKSGATVGIPAYIANGLIIGSFYFYLTAGSLVGMFLVPFLVLMLFTAIINITSLFKKKGTALLGNGASVAGLSIISLSFMSFVGIREFDAVYQAMVESNNVVTGINNAHLIGFTEATGYEAKQWGFWFLAAMFAGIWGTDTGAYFVGKAIGKRPLFKRVSPGKTWEGAIGGSIIGLAGWLAVIYFFLPEFPMLHAVILGLLIVILGQFGDLYESLLKRDAGVKDSSNIIPGHGGVYDRLDSLVFVLPVVFTYMVLLTAR